ncbi:M48 family metallopeptidase [Tessaracoccus sp. G1721]
MKHNRLAPTLVLWLFPVVAVALLVGVVLGIVAVGAQLFDGVAVRVLIQWVALPLAVAIGFGAWAALRHQAEPAEGIEVIPAEHPALWAEVNRLAVEAQTEPPARIVIVPEVNAGVAEVGGHRELEIGLPLLATFTVGQLRSVLAHELGHFAGGDTADAARDLRRLAFMEQVRARAGVLWRWFFTAYAGLYALAAGPSSRAAELRADDLSVRAAGPGAAAESFRALVAAELAWEQTLDNYVPLFELAGRRAPLGEAVRRVIDANRTEIDDAVETIIAEQRPSATDSHPPLRERIARLEASAVTGASATTGADAGRPATDLLSGGSAWLDSAEGRLLAQDRPLGSWDEVITAGIRNGAGAGADEFGASLRSLKLGDGGLDNVLRLIDDPADGGIVRRVGGADPDAREATIASVWNPVVSALLAVGAARVQPSWSGPAEVVALDGSSLELDERIGAAIDDGDSAALRGWLAELGVDVMSARTESGGGVERWLSAASHMTGPWDGRRDVHLWTTGVLALPQLDKATVKEDKDRFSEKHQHPRLYQAAAEGLRAGRSLPGSLWWDAARISGGDVTGRLKMRLRFDLDDGTALQVAATLETATVESPEDVGAAVQYLTAPKG